MNNLKRKADGHDAGDERQSKFSMQMGGSVTHLECWFFFETGRCYWGDRCRYAHHQTGLRAQQPRQDIFGATAGRNATSATPTYTQWQGVQEPVVRGTLVAVPISQLAPSQSFPSSSSSSLPPWRQHPAPSPHPASGLIFSEASPALAPAAAFHSSMPGHHDQQQQQQGSTSRDRRTILRGQVNWPAHYQRSRTSNSTSPLAALLASPAAPYQPVNDFTFTSGPSTTTNNMSRPSSSPSHPAEAGPSHLPAFSSTLSTTYGTPSSSASPVSPRLAPPPMSQHPLLPQLSTPSHIPGRAPSRPRPIVPAGSPKVTIDAAASTQQSGFSPTFTSTPARPSTSTSQTNKANQSNSPRSRVSFTIPAAGYRAFPAQPGPAPTSPLPEVPNVPLENARRALEQIDRALAWYAGAQEANAGVGALFQSLGSPADLRVGAEINPMTVRLSSMQSALGELRERVEGVVEALEGGLGEETGGSLEEVVGEGVSWGARLGAGAASGAANGDDKAFV